MVNHLTRVWSQESLQQAKQGDAKAMYWVSQMHLSGYGTIPHSPTDAEFWLKQAVKKGDIEANALHNRLFGSNLPEPENSICETTVYSLKSREASSSSSSSVSSVSSPASSPSVSRTVAPKQRRQEKQQLTAVEEEEFTAVAPEDQSMSSSPSPPSSSQPARRSRRAVLPTDAELRAMAPETRNATLCGLFTSTSFAKKDTEAALKALSSESKPLKKGSRGRK